MQHRRFKKAKREKEAVASDRNVSYHCVKYQEGRTEQREEEGWCKSGGSVSLEAKKKSWQWSSNEKGEEEEGWCRRGEKGDWGEVKEERLEVDRKKVSKRLRSRLKCQGGESRKERKSLWNQKSRITFTDFSGMSERRRRQGKGGKTVRKCVLNLV